MNLTFQKSWLHKLLGGAILTLFLISALAYLLHDYAPISSSGSPAQRVGMFDSEQSADASKLSAYPIVSDESYFPQDNPRYEYIYDGELPDLSTIDPTVYRRVNTLSFPSTLSSVFSNLTLGNIPLSSFEDPQLQSFTIAEAGDNGYVLYVDARESTLNLSRKDSYWNTIDYSKTLTKDDLLSDEELLELSGEFLGRRNIDVSMFGSPFVDRSSLDPDTWIPDLMTVTYPLIINATDTWSLWGGPIGMTVNIGLRQKEVESLYTPGPYRLEESPDELVTNSTEILAIANRGGLWGTLTENPSVTYTFQLGEPRIVFAEHSVWTNGTSSSIYVPALLFPVVKSASDDPHAPYQPPWIVVPLSKQVIDEVTGQQQPQVTP